ncbi:hypothetical protein PSN_0349 [Pseudomonas sp. NGC7]
MHKLLMNGWIQALFQAFGLFLQAVQGPQKQAFAQRPAAYGFGMPFAQVGNATCA